jgi:histidinol-phosphate/aromatic aminotransferase/cobyric acid decarboxylase-like protein
MFKNLTGYEIDTLPQSYNLTDGHAFRRWSPAEEAVIDGAARLFKHNNRRKQVEIEREYVRDYSRLVWQTWDEVALGYLMCYTASMALEIVANYLRLHRLRLALVEPCFDNLADIFHRHQVPTRPVPDALLEAPGDEFENSLRALDADGICLVTPNNPTGRTLTEGNLSRLLRFCRERGTLLILDNCFRAYLPPNLIHDQYRLVLEAGVDAMLVEDSRATRRYRSFGNWADRDYSSRRSSAAAGLPPCRR